MVLYLILHRQWFLRLAMIYIEVQVVSWYDNENSYTSQMVRTIKYFAELA